MWNLQHRAMNAADTVHSAMWWWRNKCQGLPKKAALLNRGLNSEQAFIICYKQPRWHLWNVQQFSSDFVVRKIILVTLRKIDWRRKSRHTACQPSGPQWPWAPVQVSYLIHSWNSLSLGATLHVNLGLSFLKILSDTSYFLHPPWPSSPPQNVSSFSPSAHPSLDLRDPSPSSSQFSVLVGSCTAQNPLLVIRRYIG